MILSILKIIGIVILVILALLIFILGIILFIPIRYQFDAEYEGSPKANVLVRWSPILLKVTVNYRDNKLEYVVRMLGGVVMTNLDIPLSWIGRRFFASDEENTVDSSDLDESKNEQSQGVDVIVSRENNKKTFVVINDEIEFEKPENSSRAIAIEKKTTTVTKKAKKKRQKKPKQSIIKTIRKKIQDIKYKIKCFIEKLKKINEKREALLKVYRHKRFDIAKKDIIAYIKKLWNIIKPKHLEGRIHFGMNDPATTGQMLGIMAMFLVWYDELLRIEPDFEKACFDGYLKGNGKIRFFSIAMLVIKVLLNKNLIKVIKKVQTIIEA